MDEMRYSPPKAAVDDRAGEQAFVAPPEVSKMIRGACLAGVVSCAITLVVTLVSIAGNPMLGFNAASFIDVGLIVALTFGIWRRSRACAVLMLIYFLISKFLLLRQGFNPVGIVIAVGFAWLYVQGVRGTFEYHRLRRLWRAEQDRR